MVELAVEALVTPAMIATFVGLKQDGPREEASGWAVMVAKKYAVRRDGLASFEFHSIAERDKKPELRFERSGLGWRLVGLRMPKDYLLEKVRRRP